MYVCIREISCGFFEGLSRRQIRLRTFRDPPRRPAIREWFHANTQRPVNLTPANTYHCSKILWFAKGLKAEIGYSPSA
jgi:hypothetical protein